MKPGCLFHPGCIQVDGVRRCVNANGIFVSRHVWSLFQCLFPVCVSTCISVFPDRKPLPVSCSELVGVFLPDPVSAPQPVPTPEPFCNLEPVMSLSFPSNHSLSLSLCPSSDTVSHIKCIAESIQKALCCLFLQLIYKIIASLTFLTLNGRCQSTCTGDI